MKPRRRALIVINPEARRPPKPGRLQEGIDWLQERGWSIETRVTERPGEIEELAAGAASRSFDSIVACGGDGTLREALNGVLGTETALGLIPGGTANVWAGEAGLPRDPIAALQLLERGDRPRLDCGSVDGRAFLLMASIGLDSLVAGRVSARLKRRFSILPYLAHAALELSRFEGLDAEIRMDGELLETRFVGLLAGNTRSYGGLLAITPHARADDGMLDVCIYRGSGRPRFLSALASTVFGRHLRQEEVLYRRVRSVSVKTDAPWPVQVDGEALASTPVTIECLPRAVTVIVPHDRRSPLWGATHD